MIITVFALGKGVAQQNATLKLNRWSLRQRHYLCTATVVYKFFQ
jgi:hypothetical protein